MFERNNLIIAFNACSLYFLNLRAEWQQIKVIFTFIRLCLAVTLYLSLYRFDNLCHNVNHMLLSFLICSYTSQLKKNNKIDMLHLSYSTVHSEITTFLLGNVSESVWQKCVISIVQCYSTFFYKNLSQLSNTTACYQKLFSFCSAACKI